jgi:hypothetical protein
MVDWMIEVLSNFKCEDQTFFIAATLLDRFFAKIKTAQGVADLHLLGVTAMWVSSKFTDIQPLKMKMVFEKIAHKKLSIELIKQTELKYMTVLDYKLAAPTILDFLRVYLRAILKIENQPHMEPMKVLLQKMSLYLSKMAVHDYYLSGLLPSLVAIACFYVSLKISEQLKKSQLINQQIVQDMQKYS